MIRKLVEWPAAVLRRPAERVGDVTDEVRRLVDDMVETMLASGGIGLAAPQVGVSLAVAVVLVDRSADPLVLVDPVVEKVGRDDALAAEGCLSLPGVVVSVRRPARCRVTARDVDLVCEGLLARCVQHEVDHLRGVTLWHRAPPHVRRRIDRHQT